MSRNEAIVIALIAIGVVVFLGFVLVGAERWNDKFRSKCTAAGGTPKIGRDFAICLKSDSVINIAP